MVSETTRYSSNNSREAASAPVLPRHDVLEVDAYLRSGLSGSDVEKWFTGPVPRFSPGEVAVPRPQSLQAVIEQTRAAIAEPAAFTWPPVSLM